MICSYVRVKPSYATVSKRVNIQRLKQDIWSGIDSALHIEEEAEEKKAPAAAESLSFQDMISDIAANPRQKDVSLPFYFICLLHLANEHVSIFSDAPLFWLFLQRLLLTFSFRVTGPQD